MNTEGAVIMLSSNSIRFFAEMLQRRATSEEIAKAAQEFGQEDDILVLQVRRTMNHVVAHA